MRQFSESAPPAVCNLFPLTAVLASGSTSHSGLLSNSAPLPSTFRHVCDMDDEASETFWIYLNRNSMIATNAKQARESEK